MQQNNSKGQLTAQVNLGDNVRSGFRFDYAFRGTGRLGRIYNTRMQRVYPSDEVTSNSVAALQFEPLAVPILANMYVHQESFYVPENTLWDDFDKFISGGTKLDYQGKKPSMSLQTMWRSWYDYLSVQGETGMFTNIYLSKEQGNFYATSTYIDAMQGYTLPFKVLVDNIQMLDLFEYIEDVFHKCGDYLSQLQDSNGRVLLFTKGYAQPSSTTPNDDFTLYYNESQPNKYLRKIAPSIQVLFDGINNGQGRDYIIPTPEGMQFLNYMYEIVKPFFGYSSYLDNLGYNKLTFDNFVYCFIATFTTDFIFKPSLTATTLTLDAIFDSMSMFMSNEPQDILPLRAQYSVWWNNYRDQLLETNAPEPVTTTVITDREILCLLAPRVRCWHKDTFTTALDTPGTGMVGVPITRSIYNGTPMNITSLNDLSGDVVGNLGASDDMNISEIEFNGQRWNIPTAYISGLTQLDNIKVEDMPVDGFSLYALDAAKRAQKWLQRALFFGNRIQDFLYTHFGVKYLDARLRLPELLATSKELVKLTDVINNTNVKSEDDTIAVAGDRAAIAHAYDENGAVFKRYIEEHGYIVQNITVMPDVTYANVFNRDLAMLDQFDYPFPEFSTLGMDAVYDVELAQKSVLVQSEDGSLAVDAKADVFGYQGRYYNVKSKLGEEHGELLDTQDMYTFARDFNIYDPNKRPKLNYIFVHCYPVLDMFVVDNPMSDYFRYDIYFNSGANRPFPAHSLII